MPGFTEPIRRKFEQETGSSDPAEYFHADIRSFLLKARFGGDDPASLYDKVEPETTFDEWGIGHVASEMEGAVDKTFCPLGKASSISDVEALPLPKLETDYDASVIEKHHENGYPVFTYAGSLYEWSWWLRGMERFMMDLVSEPIMAEAIIARVAEHTTRLAITAARLGVDILCMYDDAGMQRGMQISPDLWRRFIKPVWRRIIETVRAEAPHIKFFLHSCGKIDQIVPDIIEAGFDILHPIQPECMSFEEIYRQYGKDIVPVATISAQKLFPFGSPEDIRREVRRLAGVVSESRRCIFMPSNMIQPETPWENVLAFANEVRALQS